MFSRSVLGLIGLGIVFFQASDAVANNVNVSIPGGATGNNDIRVYNGDGEKVQSINVPPGFVEWLICLDGPTLGGSNTFRVHSGHGPVTTNPVRWRSFKVTTPSVWDRFDIPVFEATDGTMLLPLYDLDQVLANGVPYSIGAELEVAGGLLDVDSAISFKDVTGFTESDEPLLTDAFVDLLPDFTGSVEVVDFEVALPAPSTALLLMGLGMGRRRRGVRASAN